MSSRSMLKPNSSYVLRKIREMHYFYSLCENTAQYGGACDSHTTHPHIEDTASVRDGLGVGLRISAAAANVEADTDNLQAQLLGSLQKTSASFELRPKLDTEATHCLRVVGGNAQHQPGGPSGTRVSRSNWTLEIFQPSQ